MGAYLRKIRQDQIGKGMHAGCYYTGGGNWENVTRAKTITVKQAHELKNAFSTTLEEGYILDIVIEKE